MLLGPNSLKLNFDRNAADLRKLPNPFVMALAEASETIPTQISNFAHFAHRVEQGGIGFSADQAIGTEHVGNCVAIVVRDPVSGKTGLAHYDAASIIGSLQLLFDNMPDRKLDVVLIGAMYDENTLGNNYLRDTSRSNLQDVLSFLASKNNANIVGACIHDPKQPTNFIVNPKDFSFYPVSPDIPNPDKDLAFARKFLTGQKQPLAVEFNLTQSKDRFPYLLDREQVENINTHVKGKSHAEVAAWHSSLGARGGFENVQANLSLGTYLPAYEKALNAFIRELGEGKASTICHYPMYVGTNSLVFNRELHLPRSPEVLLPVFSK